MATFTKINDYVEAINEKKIDTANDQFVIALSNTAPASESSNPTADGNGVLANVTQISYTNLSSRDLTTASSSQTSGTFTLDFDNITLSASGGDVGPFQYVYIYDDTATNDDLVAVFDVGSAVTINDGASYDITFNASGLYTVA